MCLYIYINTCIYINIYCFLCSNRLMNNERAYRASQKYERSSFHPNKKFDFNNVQVILQDSVEIKPQLQRTAVLS